MNCNSLSQRLALLHELKKNGLYVRFHAYEYLIGFRGFLCALLLLEPHANRAYLWVFSWIPQNIRHEVVSLVRRCVETVCPALKVEVKI